MINQWAKMFVKIKVIGIFNTKQNKQNHHDPRQDKTVKDTVINEVPIFYREPIVAQRRIELELNGFLKSVL